MAYSTRIPNPFDPRSDIRKQQLSPARQRLVDLMRELNFGTILNLRIVDGEPVLDPMPRVIRRRKNTNRCEPPRIAADDFALKSELVAFFRDFDLIRDGTILLIEVAHGLPIVHEFEDVINV